MKHLKLRDTELRKLVDSFTLEGTPHVIGSNGSCWFGEREWIHDTRKKSEKNEYSTSHFKIEAPFIAI